MRILYHHRTRGEDAQGVHIAEMVEALRRLGHEVEVTSPTGRSGQARLAAIVPRRQTWMYEVAELAYNAFGFWSLVRKIQAFRPNFIYERYSLYTFCGLLAARAFHIPFILEVNAPLAFERSLAFRRTAIRLERWLCSNTTRTIVVSNQMAAFLHSVEGVPEDRLVVMPNRVNPQLFNPAVSGEVVRARYGLEGKVVIGFVGWLRSWHSLELAIETFAEGSLAERGGHLFIVGDGPAYVELVHLADRLGLWPHTTFTGPVPRPEVPGYIAAMDVVIQPGATPYASPIKLIEYMAMGRAIVAVAQPNIEEVLQNGRNALLFPAGNRSAFGETLARLIEDEGLRKRLGQAALRTVQERGLYWEENAKAVLRIVDEVQKDGRKRNFTGSWQRETKETDSATGEAAGEGKLL